MAALFQGVRSSLVLSSCVLRSTLTKSAILGLQQKCKLSNLSHNQNMSQKLLLSTRYYQLSRPYTTETLTKDTIAERVLKVCKAYDKIHGDELKLESHFMKDLWRLDVLGISEPIEPKSKETLATDAMEHFRNTVTVNSENRYEVILPWIEGHPKLLDNRDMAEKRLHTVVTKKLMKLGKFSEYDQVFSEWLNAGITEKVKEPSSCHRPIHYLPHHAVIKESSLTTKIRPVFDASALDSNGSCQVVGYP